MLLHLGNVYKKIRVAYIFHGPLVLQQTGHAQEYFREAHILGAHLTLLLDHRRL